jgi:hypothetical protein
MVLPRGNGAPADAHDASRSAMPATPRSVRIALAVVVTFGAVPCFSESVVRGRGFASEGGLFGAGYHVTGPAILVGGGKRPNLSSRFFLSLAAQLSAARAQVPVAGGEASAPNLALHGQVGLGFRS